MEIVDVNKEWVEFLKSVTVLIEDNKSREIKLTNLYDAYGMRFKVWQALKKGIAKDGR